MNQVIRQLDKNMAMIAKYFNISPIELLNGDFHYYVHQYNLAVEDEFEMVRNEQKKVNRTKRVYSLFEAFN
ncbi:hypothetical protein ERX35_007830 [Macrococcus equipercicus]|uniref:Uncharacterized protein n=1 Tax=Macrococcus equipercicus TaxID=69967 RepID=A0ABQ6R7P7_9STAP|nr:hypothetical protein [Macrococcus equipercicus]KAA1039116.1 hypothetical protein ERX35_007830 [Macrococcus equipercicus]